ncbi:MAG: hypothetical protein WBG19_09665 [Thermoplasmata archaeon]
MGTDVQNAADIVADAAERAAERVAMAAKSAMDSAASAASAASSASQILGAVAISRLDGIDKQFNSHEKQDTERFHALTEEIKDTKKELKNEMKDIQIDLKKQTKILTLMTGGLIALSKLPDFISFFIHH